MAQTWSVFREFAQRSFCSSFFTALLPWVSFGSLRVSIPSADSRSELCGTDTHCLRCVGCNRDFFSPVFRIGFEAPIHPPLVACPVLHRPAQRRIPIDLHADCRHRRGWHGASRCSCSSNTPFRATVGGCCLYYPPHCTRPSYPLCNSVFHYFLH